MTKFLVFVLFVFISCGNQQEKTTVNPLDKDDLNSKETSQADAALTEGEKTTDANSEKIKQQVVAVENSKAPFQPQIIQISSSSKPEAIEKEDIEVAKKEIEVSSEPIDKNVVNTEKPIESEVKEKVQENQKEPEGINHSTWNSLLTKYVNSKGDVNYKAFKNDVSALDKYLLHLSENSPEKNWSKNKKLAYYINIYNAATVKLILDNYPTKSIKDIKNSWGKNWVKTGDGLLSLGDIEHKILRKMNEPRIHFAINCASYSCPKLINTAFEAKTMQAQLKQVTHDFINDTSRNIITKEKMQLSNIFKWYKKDFTENGSLVDYIKPYTKIEINQDTDIDYLKYDWKLNEEK